MAGFVGRTFLPPFRRPLMRQLVGGEVRCAPRDDCYVSSRLNGFLCHLSFNVVLRSGMIRKVDVLNGEVCRRKGLVIKMMVSGGRDGFFPFRAGRFPTGLLLKRVNLKAFRGRLRLKDGNREVRCR